MNWLRRRLLGPLMVATPSMLMMLVFFFLPVIIMVAYSFLQGELFQVSRPFNLDNYDSAFSLPFNRTLAWNSFLIGVIVATITVVVGLPVAYWLHFSGGRWSTPVVSLVVASMFAGYLVRIYAWRTVLGTNGVINASLQRTGLADEPISFIIFSKWSVAIAELHLMLPFAIVMLFAAIRPIRSDHLEAAEDLGASPFVRWRRVILPLMAAPMASAWMFVFIVSSSDFVTPQFLGGIDGQLVGTQINRYFREVGDYGKGSALAVLLILFYVALWALIQLLLRRFRLNEVEWD